WSMAANAGDRRPMAKMKTGERMRVGKESAQRPNKRARLFWGPAPPPSVMRPLERTAKAEVEAATGLAHGLRLVGARLVLDRRILEKVCDIHEQAEPAVQAVAGQHIDLRAGFGVAPEFGRTLVPARQPLGLILRQ